MESFMASPDSTPLEWTKNLINLFYMDGGDDISRCEEAAARVHRVVRLGQTLRIEVQSKGYTQTASPSVG